MRAWSRTYSNCRNCGTERYPHKGRGYCRRCYPLMKRRKQAELGTLGGYPNDSYKDSHAFSSTKSGHIKQLNQRLETLLVRERKLAGPIDGIDIEYQLRRIAKLAKSRNKELYFGIASTMNDLFRPDQKLFLYGLLNELEESIPWKGINWNRLYID